MIPDDLLSDREPKVSDRSVIIMGHVLDPHL